MNLAFTKMHGCGNDYIYIDCFSQPWVTGLDLNALAARLSDRHFGIGSDGLVLIMPSATSSLKMRMFNADGSEAEMCGNASRCVGRYAYEHGLVSQPVFTLETLAGEKTITVNLQGDVVKSITVDMGAPRLEAAEIPVALSPADVRCIAHPIALPAEVQPCLASFEGGAADTRFTAVNMGNPHAVYFLDSLEALEALPLERIGSAFEHHTLFPRRVNSEFVYCYNRQHARMRVWERGTGETWACGTGSCATLVAAVLTGHTDRTLALDLNGGTLDLTWEEATNHVLMTGPATHVFDGLVALPE